MPEPSELRDSTQIVVREPELDGLRAELESEFTVTITPLDLDGDWVRIIASPVVVNEVETFLRTEGVKLP